MLLSHRHGYLFVHIAKTGGTSVRAALSAGRWRDPLYWPTWLSHRMSELTNHRVGIKIPRHAAVIVAQEMLPPSTFGMLFKFAFVRNPWDRLVSAYSHFRRERQDVLRAESITSFDEFVHFIIEAEPDTCTRGALVQAIKRPQLESLIGLHGELLVDFVGRYENLNDDFQQVVFRLGLTHLTLPHMRRSERKQDFRRHYSDRLAECVAMHYADDLAAFQYEFEPETPSQADGQSSITNQVTTKQVTAIAGRIPPNDGFDKPGGAIEC